MTEQSIAAELYIWGLIWAFALVTYWLARHS